VADWLPSSVILLPRFKARGWKGKTRAETIVISKIITDQMLQPSPPGGRGSLRSLNWAFESSVYAIMPEREPPWAVPYHLHKTCLRNACTHTARGATPAAWIACLGNGYWSTEAFCHDISITGGAFREELYSPYTEGLDLPTHLTLH
jgi:hypothetical protein